MKMSSTVAHSESEVQNKMTSEESPIFESDLPKEGRCPNSELSMKTETEDPACSNGEAEKNVKIKEEAAEIDVGLQNEDACSSANHGDVCGIFPKVMIKVEGEEEEEEEPWCQERAFPCNPEAPSVSDCQIYNVTKDGANEDFSVKEITRFHTETASSSCSDTTCLLITPDLEENHSIICGNDFEDAEPSTSPLNGSDTETPYPDQSVQYRQSKISHENKQSDELNNHCSNKVHVCGICESSFSHLNALKAHIVIHKSKKSNSCDVRDLKGEVLIDESKRSYKCEVCEKTFCQLGNLKRHILIHEGIRPFKCHICEKTFTQVGDLNRHLLLHEGKRPYQCNVCLKSFSQMSHLNQHTLIHEGKRTYKCEVCEKSFNRLGYLKRHIIIHEGKRPYQCEVCEKRFIQKGDLKRHSLIHEGKKPYECNICEKSFSQLGSLKRHFLKHEGKSPYQCNVCPKSFTRMGHLEQHSLIHAGERPYKCDVCEKRFTQKGNLNKHVLIHRNQKP